MQARYYDPVIGRFYSNDPIGWVANNPIDSFNRYSYANNNPYKYVDPDGRIVVYAGSVTVEGTKTVTTSKGGESVNGVQVTLEASSPTAKVHQHNGVGTAVKIGGVTTQDLTNAGAAVSQAVYGG